METEPGGGRGDREGSPRLPTSSSPEAQKLCVLRPEALAPLANKGGQPRFPGVPTPLPGLRGVASAPGPAQWRGRAVESRKADVPEPAVSHDEAPPRISQDCGNPTTFVPSDRLSSVTLEHKADVYIEPTPLIALSPLKWLLILSLPSIHPRS